MIKGTKRASPGAEGEKDPLQSVELTDEDAKKLQEIQRALARAELILERDTQARLRPIFEKRREVLKSIPNFWPVALMNHPLVGFFVQHGADKTALSYLEDVWVEKHPKEHRCFTIEFHFKENQFFEDRVIKKEYNLIPSPAAADEKADEDGITDSMFEFEWERDVDPSETTIKWKDDAHALTKVYPRRSDEDDENDVPADPGSFFNFFECKADQPELGPTIANEVFPDAIEYFLGNMGGEELDSDEDEEEDDDDDEADDIDLEKPRNKKQRV